MCRKLDILNAGEFTYDYVYGTYVNKTRRVIVSIHFIDDHSAEELADRIRDAPSGKEWHFICNNPPSTRVRNEILAEYGP